MIRQIHVFITACFLLLLCTFDRISAQQNDGDWLFYDEEYIICIDQLSGTCFEAFVDIFGSIEASPCGIPRKLDFVVREKFGNGIWYEKLNTTQTQFSFPLPLGEWTAIITGYDECFPSVVYDTMSILVENCGPPYAPPSYGKALLIDDDSDFQVIDAIKDVYSGSTDCLQGGFIDTLKIKVDDGGFSPTNLVDSIIFTIADTGYQKIQLWEYSWGGWVYSGFTYYHVYLPYDNSISGTVYYDQNENCHFDDGEPGVQNRTAYLSNFTIADDSDSTGYYKFNYPVPSNPGFRAYSGLIAPFDTGCLKDSLIENTLLDHGSIHLDWGVQLLPDCYELQVDISAPFLRRCLDSYYWVNYCNAGTDTASNAFIEITFDSFLNVEDSSLPWSDISGDTYTFPIGDIAGGACGRFQILVNADCDNSELGQLHCTEAHIYPDETCRDSTKLWGGGNIEIKAACTETNVEFTIKNTGLSPTSAPLDYFIVEDDIIIFYNTLDPLSPGDSIIETLPKNGSFYLAQSQQEPFHPFGNDVSAFIEGCVLGTDSVSLGYFGQFPINDMEPFLDLDCIENQGSFDPNDKKAIPQGYGENHYIEPGDLLEYMIRFQNTGTDTAFTVRIVDTLSEHLLIGTFNPLVASHPYTFSFSPDGVAEFLFSPIALPDSNINETASHGFIKFEIQTRKDLAPGTIIENEASIYFDLNQPVITNIVQHQIEPDFPFEIFSAYEPPPEAPTENIWISYVNPNPAGSQARIVVAHPFEDLKADILIFDQLGRQILDLRTNQQGAAQIPSSRLHDGIYFYHVLKHGILVNTGSFVKGSGRN
jgi:uncharacterized repeat protein (TIGR01451 family)